MNFTLVHFTTITVLVEDKLTRDPVVGIDVTILGSSDYKATTDSDGFVQFNVTSLDYYKSYQIGIGESQTIYEYLICDPFALKNQNMTL